MSEAEAVVKTTFQAVCGALGVTLKYNDEDIRAWRIINVINWDHRNVMDRMAESILKSVIEQGKRQAHVTAGLTIPIYGLGAPGLALLKDNWLHDIETRDRSHGVFGHFTVINKEVRIWRTKNPINDARY